MFHIKMKLHIPYKYINLVLICTGLYRINKGSKKKLWDIVE